MLNNHSLLELFPSQCHLRWWIATAKLFVPLNSWRSSREPWWSQHQHLDPHSMLSWGLTWEQSWAYEPGQLDQRGFQRGGGSQFQRLVRPDFSFSVSFWEIFLSFCQFLKFSVSFFFSRFAWFSGICWFVLLLFLGLLRGPTWKNPKRVRDTIRTFPEKKERKPSGFGTPSPAVYLPSLKYCLQAMLSNLKACCVRWGPTRPPPDISIAYIEEVWRNELSAQCFSCNSTKHVNKLHLESRFLRVYVCQWRDQPLHSTILGYSVGNIPRILVAQKHSKMPIFLIFSPKVLLSMKGLPVNYLCYNFSGGGSLVRFPPEHCKSQSLFVSDWLRLSLLAENRITTKHPIWGRAHWSAISARQDEYSKANLAIVLLLEPENYPTVEAQPQNLLLAWMT